MRHKIGKYLGTYFLLCVGLYVLSKGFFMDCFCILVAALIQMCAQLMTVGRVAGCSRDLVANVWVDQTTGERALFFIFIVVLLRKSLVGMPRGCLVKEGKCLEGTIIFHVGQQIILSHSMWISSCIQNTVW